jgi:hypothetical protein
MTTTAKNPGGPDGVELRPFANPDVDDDRANLTPAERPL